MMIRTWEPGKSFTWGDFSINVYFLSLDSQNTFYSNLNTTNLKMFPKYGGIYRFETKILERKKAL